MQMALNALGALWKTWGQRLTVWRQDRKYNASSDSDEAYRKAIEGIAELKKNRRFLVDGTFIDFVSSVMAAHKRTEEILISGMSQKEVSLYETVLSASTCPVKIVLGTDDDLERLRRLSPDTRKRIMCWQHSTEDKKERHFILFGQTAFVFNYVRDPTRWNGSTWEGWLANFNEPNTARDLRIRFDKLVKESIPRSVFP